MNRRRTALYATALVAVYVYQPAQLTLFAQERVRLDRLVYSAVQGFNVERHGDLMEPGTSEIALRSGVYYLRVGRDARLTVPDDGSVVVPDRTSDPKDPWPLVAPPPEFEGLPAALWVTHGATAEGRGVGAPGRQPSMAITFVSRDQR